MTYHNPRHMRHALLLFCPYLAALWFSAWYDLHFYGGSYGTTAADLLLTLALVSALFPPIIAPERNTRLFKIIACAAAAAAVAAIGATTGVRNASQPESIVKGLKNDPFVPGTIVL